MKTKVAHRQGLDSIVILILLALSTMVLIVLVFIPVPSQASVVPPADGEPSATNALTDSVSQCPSGYLCLWTGASYTGSFTKYSSTSGYRVVTYSTVKSMWNNRSKRSYFYSGSSGSGSSQCYGPGVKTGNLGGWQSSPNSVHLSLTTNC